MNEGQAKIVFLTSPNNPDGSMISEADLLEILQLAALIVLDEAYIEFSEVRFEHSKTTQASSAGDLSMLQHL